MTQIKGKKRKRVLNPAYQDRYKSYKLSNKQGKNKAAKLVRHLKKHPEDRQATDLNKEVDYTPRGAIK